MFRTSMLAFLSKQMVKRKAASYLSIFFYLILYDENIAERAQTVIFKSVGTDAPNTHYLPKRDSPSPPVQCWIVLSIVFGCKMMR